MPDPGRFTEVIGGELTRAARGGRRLRVFGEMVGLLLARGHASATVRLEDLWNELRRTHEFRLFCAYPLAELDERAGWRSPIAEVCARHSRVIPVGEPRARWDRPRAAGRARDPGRGSPPAPRDQPAPDQPARRGIGAARGPAGGHGGAGHRARPALPLRCGATGPAPRGARRARRRVPPARRGGAPGRRRLRHRVRGAAARRGRGHRGGSHLRAVSRGGPQGGLPRLPQHAPDQPARRHDRRAVRPVRGASSAVRPRDAPHGSLRADRDRLDRERPAAPASAGRAGRPPAVADPRAHRPRGSRDRQPDEGRVPGHRLARAADPAERDPGLVAHPSLGQARRGHGGPGRGGDRAKRPDPGPAHRGHPRRLARDHRAACASTAVRWTWPP